MTPKFFGFAILLALLACASAQTMITDCTGLQNMNLDLAGNYALANNIDCSDTVNWNGGKGFTPIGSSSDRFTGQFSGNGYRIEHLVINDLTLVYVGLFGFIESATISNTEMVSVNITVRDALAGSLVGANLLGVITQCGLSGDNFWQEPFPDPFNPSDTIVGGLVGVNVGIVSHCFFEGNMSSTNTQKAGGLVGKNSENITQSHVSGNINISLSDEAGGLVGHAEGGTISNSSVDITLRVTIGVFHAADIGGLVGLLDERGAIINNHAQVDITAYKSANFTLFDTSFTLGSLLGKNEGGTVFRNSASGTISALGYSGTPGGLVGKNTYGLITESHAAVTVISDIIDVGTAGGLVGDNSGQITQCYATGAVSSQGDNVGALVGINGGIVAHSYATGQVTSPGNHLGGVIGDAAYGYVAQSYWDVDTTGQTTSGGSLPTDGKTTAQMYQLATYSGWDFSCTWQINEGSSYPTLQATSCADRQIDVANCLALQSAAFQMNAHIQLTQDIDCSDTPNWNGGQGFVPGFLAAGRFDGRGHTITGLTINKPSSGPAGFFSETGLSSVIENLGLEALNITGGRFYVGGLVGVNVGSISKCYANVDIVTTSSNDCGGLVGKNEAEISYSYAHGYLSGGNSASGAGLVGFNVGTLLQSYATTFVTNVVSAGGLIADHREADYNTDSSDAPQIFQCYWDGESTGQSTSEGSDPSDGKTTAQMYMQATYVDWDFTNTWQINEGSGYPFLQYNALPPQTQTPSAPPAGETDVPTHSQGITQSPTPSLTPGITHSATQSPVPTPSPGITSSPTPSLTPEITHSQTPSSVPTPSPSSGKGSSNGSSTLIIGAAAGASAVVVLGAAAGLIFYRQRNGGSNGRNARELM